MQNTIVFQLSGYNLLYGVIRSLPSWRLARPWCIVHDLDNCVPDNCVLNNCVLYTAWSLVQDIYRRCHGYITISTVPILFWG